MTTKRPDVLANPPSPLTALTLGEMHHARWTLVSRCAACGLALKTNVAALIRLHGPDAIWWGHRTACPGLDCGDGVLVYSAQAIRGGAWVRMNHPPDPQYVAAWKGRRGRAHPGPR